MIKQKYLTDEVVSDYQNRILDAYPERSYDEAMDLADGFAEPVYLTFGSSSYEVSLRSICGYQTSSIFLYGYCALFASTFAKLSNHTQFLLFSDKDKDNGWSGHVALYSEDGTIIDYNGKVSMESLVSQYPAEKYDCEIVSEEVFRSVCFKDDYISDPFHNLDPLEIAFTHAVVEEIFEEVQ